MTSTATKPARTPIRGNDGCDVYLRADGYVVEHFSLSGSETRIIYRSAPFATREEARAHEREYRGSAFVDVAFVLHICRQAKRHQWT